MAPQRPEFYVVDDAANFATTNAKTQKDVLYYERDTGLYKLGSGERWLDTPYYSPGVSIDVDNIIKGLIGDYVDKSIEKLDVEPRIADKKTAFNLDFGDTKDSVARGKHVHGVSDINGLVIPESVDFPEVPEGKVLFDDKTFKLLDIVSLGSFNAHIKSNVHITPEEKANLHSILTVVGPGLKLSGQELSLKFGDSDLCKGKHEHTEYAPVKHSHPDVIPADKLPAVTRNSCGAVPPTGNPSGKTLHDNGTWQYVQSLSLVRIDAVQPFWIAPCEGIVSFASLASLQFETTDVHKNGGSIVRIDTEMTKLHGFFEAHKLVNVEFKPGDVFQAPTSEGAFVQLGVILYR